MVQVPVGGLGSGFRSTGRFDKLATSGPAAGGRMEVRFPAVPSGFAWLIERCVISSTSTTQTEARLYADREDPAALLDGTRSGNLDIADNTSPLQVTGSLALLVVWTGAVTGAVGTARVQGTIVEAT